MLPSVSFYAREIKESRFRGIGVQCVQQSMLNYHIVRRNIKMNKTSSQDYIMVSYFLHILK